MISNIYLITKALYIPLVGHLQKTLDRSVGTPTTPASLESDYQLREQQSEFRTFLSSRPGNRSSNPSYPLCSLYSSRWLRACVLGRASHFQVMANPGLFSE